MYKNELVARVTRALEENKTRKPVHLEKRMYEIIDTTYNSRETLEGKIIIQPKDKKVRYTQEDVSNILEMIIYVIQDEVAHGGNVAIKGLGTFGTVWRQPKRAKIPNTEQWVDIPGRFVPKFSPTYGLRNAAHVYTMSLQNNPIGFQTPDPVYDQFEQPEIEDEEGDVDGIDK